MTVETTYGTTEPSSIDEAAQRLWLATSTGVPCPPVRELIGADDVALAYEVQSRNIERLLRTGRTVVGRKIGLTSPAVQAQLGVDQPDFGVLLDDMDYSGQREVPTSVLLQPKIEAEIAFVLERDITEHVNAVDAAQAVGTVAPAFEIVDSRIAGWDIGLADTIADNASSGLFVLGTAIARDSAPTLAEVSMTMTEDGAAVSSGRGSDCLGSPWESLAWLANICVDLDSPLRAGDLVLSGALGPMVTARPGSEYRALISGIGTVTARFANKQELDKEGKVQQ